MGLAAGCHSGLKWPLVAASPVECACGRHGLCALVLVPGVGAGARHSWCIVASMRKLPLATVTLVCWSQRCLALLAAQPDFKLPSSSLFFCLMLQAAFTRDVGAT